MLGPFTVPRSDLYRQSYHHHHLRTSQRPILHRRRSPNPGAVEGKAHLSNLNTRTPERLHRPHSTQRIFILPRMLIKHVTIRQEELVDRPVGVTDGTVHRIGTTVGKYTVARMHSSRMCHPIRLIRYAKLRRRCRYFDYRRSHLWIWT